MASNPIFVGLDTSDLAAARAMARAVAPHVGGLKLGLQFFTAHGAEGVRRMADIGLPIFLDLKLHDIPNTVAGALRSLASLALYMTNVHASGGLAMMQAARDICPPTTKLIAVTVLTSFDAVDLAGVGVADAPTAQVARLAALTRLAGLDGVVCSAHEVAALSAGWPRGEFVVPGIRPVGAAPGDQKRVTSPEDALAAGATMLVIGRPITDAPDPAAAAAAIAASL